MSSTHPTPDSRPPNRLDAESSPYLRQHRLNPVDWWPWGEAAFAEARRLDRPIFLSIGYSTCYWCHVMERESFENDGIARQLNGSFVCIKVDREERPDVDDVYMSAVQAFTGHGGWPMSLFLEPRALKPFFAGTYFPPVEKAGYAMPSFPRVLDSMAGAWREQREDVLKQAEELAEAVRERVLLDGVGRSPVRVGQAEIGQAVAQALRMADRRFGGFGGEGGAGPKFPQAPLLELLLSVRPAGDEATRAAIDAALRTTLDAMALGGLFDQVGGGFHRYSVDARWIVPHFEKMLYDNAMLASVYARAAVVYDDAWYRRIAEQTIEYMLRDLGLREVGAAGEGGVDRAALPGPPVAFFSAQDAEVDGREGLNYLWTRDELIGALGETDGSWAARVFGVDAGPNFRDPHHPDAPPRSVLVLGKRPDEWAGQMQVTVEAFLARLDDVRARLLSARDQRRQPGTDDKVLTAWNAMAVCALVDAGVALGRADLVQIARGVAGFLLREVRVRAEVPPVRAAPKRGDQEQAELGRAWRRGEDGRARCSVPAVLEDYALLLRGLSSLARVDGGEWLDRAHDLLKVAQARFAATEGEAQGQLESAGESGMRGPESRTLLWFDTPAGRGDLFVRPMSVIDGAMPGASGVLLNALVDLAGLEPQGPRRTEINGVAAATLRGLTGWIARAPLACASATLGLFRLLRTDPEIVRRAMADAVAASPSNPVEPGARQTPDDVVEVLSGVERVSVGPGAPALVPLRLRIRPGYHITAAISSDDQTLAASAGAAALRVHIVNGSGVRAYADYPPGSSWADQPALLVHEGEVDLEVVLEREGEWAGQPLLAVTYQACTDRACLRPRTVELDVAIDRG